MREIIERMMRDNEVLVELANKERQGMSSMGIKISQFDIKALEDGE